MHPEGEQGCGGQSCTGHGSGRHRVMTGAVGVARQAGSSPQSQDKGGSFISSAPFPRRPSCPGTLTPSNEEEEPLAQVLRGVRHDDGSVQVAALHKHPEEVGDHEVVKDGGDAAAPDLRVGRGGESCWDRRAGPTERQGTSHFGAGFQIISTLSGVAQPPTLISGQLFSPTPASSVSLLMCYRGQNPGLSPAWQAF